MEVTLTLQNSTKLKELNDLLNKSTTTASRATLKISSLVLDNLELKLGKVKSKWFSESKSRLTLQIGE